MDANELARESMNDEDPIVLARILVQMRNRGIRVTLPRLLELADSQHIEVRTAVKQCLGDFTVQRYLMAFDMLDDAVRRTTGILVSKVDKDLIESLTSELESLSRTRRIRALQAVPFLGVGSEVESLILDAIQSDDHFVRSEAAAALVHCRSKEAQFALREALLDSRSSVQEAAEQALQEMADASVQNSDGKLAAADLASLLEDPLTSELGMEFLM